MHCSRRTTGSDLIRAAATIAAVLLIAAACSDDGTDANPVRTFNELLAEEAPTWSTETSPVVVVDHFTWFDPETHSLDGIHPNPLGEEQMAARWVTAVQQQVGAPTDQSLRVMPLGDSITDDYTRYDTWKKLVEAGYTVDVVGTQTSVPSSKEGDTPDVNGLPFDQDHEGHAAWAASDMLAGHDDHPEEGNIESWVDQVDADVVLLHIGTNDIGRLGTDPRLVVDRTSRIVFQIQLAMPDATIFVAQITPLGSEK